MTRLLAVVALIGCILPLNAQPAMPTTKQNQLESALADMHSGSAKVRMQAIIQLDSNVAPRRDNPPPADPRVLAALTEALHDPVEHNRYLAAQVLGDLATPDAASANALAACIADPGAGNHGPAADALALMHDPRAVDLATVVLGDSDYRVRGWAVGALRDAKDPRAIPPLLSALQDRSADVRMRAADALAERPDSRSVQSLIDALTTDSSIDVRASAARALGATHDPRAVPPLIAMLQSPGPPRNNITPTREVMADALGAIGPAAVPALEKVLGNPDPEVDRYAYVGLALVRDPRVTALLIKALKDSDPLNRDLAAATLAQSGAPEASIALRSEYESGDRAAVAAAYAFFLAHKDVASDSELIAALNEFGKLPMAQAFLDSSDTVLQEAAERWARTHSLLIAPAQSSGKRTIYAMPAD